jgi:hypothetical protein
MYNIIIINQYIGLKWLKNFIKGRIVRENWSSIFLSNFTYLTTELQITKDPFPKNQRVNTKKQIDYNNY